MHLSISLVKECNLVKNNSKFCIMDIDLNQNFNENKNEYFDERSQKKFKQKDSVLINCTFETVNYDKPSKNINDTCSVILNENQTDNDNSLYKNLKYPLISITELNTKLQQEPDMKICVHSHVFDYIFFRNKEGSAIEDDPLLDAYSSENKNPLSNNNTNQNPEINILRQLIVDKGILFFRMNPNDKTKLVQLFKKQDPNNIVAMCGDGAND